MMNMNIKKRFLQICMLCFLVMTLSASVFAMPGDTSGVGNDSSSAETTAEEAVDLSCFDTYSPRALQFEEVLRKGIDVSAFTGGIDWQKVYDSGIEFVFVRAGIRGYGDEGKLVKDNYVERNIEGAQTAGLRVGVYFYSQATTEEEARQEFLFLMEIIQGYDLELPVVFDFEYAEAAGVPVGRLYKAELTNEQRTAICNAFVDEAYKYGYESVIYANQYMLSEQLNAAELAAPVWLAQYASNVTYDGSYSFWQCSDSAYVPGISTKVDIDFWFDATPHAGWISFNGNRYYRNSSLALAKGWSKIDGVWYYFNSEGIMQTGWKQLKGKWYYLNKDGSLQTGWKQLKGKWYYLNKDGSMQTGWKQLSGKWYYMNSDGVMQTGWKQLSGTWYYMDASGAMQTGWKQLSGKWYCFDVGGAMQTGWKQISGKWYYLNADGAMQTGWLSLKGKWYYLDASGAMVTGNQSIGGKRYTFDSNGVLI